MVAHSVLTCSVLHCYRIMCVIEWCGCSFAGSLDVLLDVYHNSDAETQEHSVLVLRNLCFFGPSKTMLASNGMNHT